MAEYNAILSIFKKFLEKYQNETDRWELLQAIIDMRIEFMVNHALQGFNLSLEDAMDLVRSKNYGLTSQDKESRKILLAALDNIIDFAVAEEFQMAYKVSKIYDSEDEENEENCEDICYLYNHIYANVENDDVNYAMGIAAGWVKYNESTILTYMTQGDERVRPWHIALEGTSYPKSSFPAWLIPPIDYGCRCFLIEEGDDVLNHKDLANIESKIVDKPDFINPIFSDSVCKGGKIFGAQHPYFQIPKGYKRKLKSISKSIKEKWLDK